MDIAEIREKHTKLEEAYLAARSHYYAECNKISEEVGKKLKSIREAAGINCTVMGRLMQAKTPRVYCHQLENGVVGADGRRWYSVSAVLDAVATYEAICAQVAGLSRTMTRAVAQSREKANA